MLGYAIVRTDNMVGTDARSNLVSLRYLGSGGSTPTAIENGHVLKVGAHLSHTVDTSTVYEREIYIGGDVAANDALKDIVLVATPELMYDERLHGLDDFINEAGTTIRGYRLHSGETFSVTKPALAGASAPAVGDVVELAAGTKLSVVAAATGATQGSTVVGKIDSIETVGRFTFYTILVA